MTVKVEDTTQPQAPQADPAFAPAPPDRNSKVAIVGFAPSYPDAPFADESWDIWGLNELYGLIPMDKIAQQRLTWFDIHTVDVMKASSRDGKRIENLAKLPCRVFTQREMPEIKNSIAYPLAYMTFKYFGGDANNELQRAWALYQSGTNDRDELAVGKFGYWTNTITMMILLAVEEGYREIGIWGVDMASDTEYAPQRPSCEYAIGYARGEKVKVSVHPKADLLKARFVYGYQDLEQEWQRAKMREKRQLWANNMAQAQRQEQDAHDRAQQFLGAIQAADEIGKIFGQ